MKTSILTIFLLLLISSQLYSQNIVFTFQGTGGSFVILDGANTLFTLDQTTGSLSLNSGLWFKGPDRFMHSYQAPGKLGQNTFVGLNSGNFTMGGGSFGSINASGNTAVGNEALSLLTSGFDNSAVGNFALQNNTTGFRNSAFGVSALDKNTAANDNSAFGHQALRDNAGEQNSAFGGGALLFNTTGNYNSAFGYSALVTNTVGQSNAAFGWNALLNNNSNRNSAFGVMTLQENTSGSLNSAYGSNALDHNTTGSQNSSFGTDAGTDITTGNNNITIGYDAEVPSGTASNQVRIGDAFITYAGVQVAWTITSDRRWKKNIESSPLGLGFISKLNPVSYVRKNDEAGKTEYGFIAQEIEETLNSFGISNSAMINVTGAGNYEMRYNDLFAPVVKAIQDLKKENDELKAANENIKAANEKLQSAAGELSEKLTRIEKIQDQLIAEIEKLKSNNTEIALVSPEKK